MKKVFVLSILILSFLLLVGCKVQQVAPAKEPVVAPVPEPVVQPAEEPAAEVPLAPKCGDGICNGSENCDRCIKDCACVSPAECYQGRCKVPECGGDGDCRDNSTCTIDVCEFAQHPNAYCSHEVIAEFKNNDGCCPAKADAETDTDCEAVCGNNVCEIGETDDSCEKDCALPECGDGDCEEGETAEDCAADCS